MASDPVVRSRSGWLGVALILAAATLSTQSWAEPSAADKETARALMKEGDTLLQAREYARALQAYRGAHAIMNVPTTGIAVVRSLHNMHRLVEARDMALQVARIPKVDSEPEVFAAARTEAESLAQDLEGRIPSIRVQVEGFKHLNLVRVSIDGTTLPQVTAFLPRKVNPGKHVVSATAPLMPEAQTEVIVAERENRIVKLTLGEKPAAPVSAAAPQPQPAPQQPEPLVPPKDEAPQPSKPVSPLVYVGFSVAGAGVLIGSITGGMSLSKTSTLKSECPEAGCPPSRQGEIDSANTLANVSNVSFGLALVGAGLGVYGLLFPPAAKPVSPKTATRLRAWPELGPGSLGVRGQF